MQYPIIDLITDAYINNGWTGLDINTSYVISYVQEGSGTPSTRNIRNIIPGYFLNGVGIVDGTLNINDKTLVSKKGFYVLNGSEVWTRPGTGSARNYLMRTSKNNIKFASNDSLTFISNYLQCIPESATYGNYDEFISAVSNNDISCGIRTIETVEGWKEYLSNHNLQIIYDYINPVTYTLTVNDIINFIGDKIFKYVSNMMKLPLPHYFPHPVIDALQHAAAGTQTADDTEILRHYLTPLGIGGI